MADPCTSQTTAWVGIPPGDDGKGCSWHMLRPRYGGEPFPALWPHDWSRTRWRVPSDGLDMVAIAPADLAAECEYVGRCVAVMP